MDSKLKSVTILVCVLMVMSVLGMVLYTNRSKLGTNKGDESISSEETLTDVSENDSERQIGNNLDGFMEDDTFFNPEPTELEAYLQTAGKQVSLVLSSVEKDLRIQVVDVLGKLITGENFSVIIGDMEYEDDDEDGVIYISKMKPGDYEVELKEIEGYRMPDAPSFINVKEVLEYKSIDDISLLIYTEDDIDPSVEDVRENDARNSADGSENTDFSQVGDGKFGIDVSKWNYVIDWEKVADTKVEYAIVRLGYRGAQSGLLVEDPYFEKNMEGTMKVNIPVGVYFFTQAINEVEAVEEASMVVELCKHYPLSYPVFIDTEGAGENARANDLSVEQRTAVIKAFCETIKNAGYTPGVYASKNWFKNRLNANELESYVLWLAEYADKPSYEGYYDLWQYTSKGSIDGIEGNVDLDLSFLVKKVEEATDDSNE